MSTNSEDSGNKMQRSSPDPHSLSRSVGTVHKHVFQVHNYKKPTFCEHCGGFLVGVIKQGMRCKRCKTDVHERCQEDIKKKCIEVIVGNHNFFEKSYTKPTYCDYCEKLLVGVVNQGLKCSECDCNVHEKCQEKIEPTCGEVRKRLDSQKAASPPSGIQRERKTRVSERRRRPNEKTPLSKQPIKEENEERNYSQLFHEMPTDAPPTEAATETAAPKPNEAKPPLPATQVLQQQVGEVTSIMEQNIKRIEERHAKLEDLEAQSNTLVDGASHFKQQAKKLKRKYWYKNMKLWIGIGVAVFVLIIVIVVVVVIKNSGSKSSSTASPTKDTST